MTVDKCQYEQDEASLTRLIQHVLHAVRSAVGMDFGFVSEFDGGMRIFRYVDGHLADIKPGDGSPLAESYCYYVVRGEMPSLLRDALSDPIAATIAATKELPVGSHLSVPIALTSGGIFGTLCCLSYKPIPTLGAHELAIVGVGARIIASILEAAGVRRDDYIAAENAVTDVLARRAISIVYQPICRLADEKVVGFEALARFDLQPARSPDKWFADAERVGLGVDLEFLAIEEAMAGFLSFPQPSSISLNLSPASIASQRFTEFFEAMPLDRVILEVTEHAAIDSYETLRSKLAPLRAKGLRLAIDDVGAGYSSFRHVLDLAPDLIKLNISLVRNIDLDRGRQALVGAIAQFGHRIGCEVVAEGVENRAELLVLADLGVTKVQGYLISKPRPLELAKSFAWHGLNDALVASDHTSKSLGVAIN